MRGQDDVVMPGQRADEGIAVALRFDREHVHRGAADVAAFQRGVQRIDVDHGAARGIDQVRARLHRRQLRRADHVLGGRGFGHMQGDDVGAGQQVLQRGCRLRIAQRQLGLDVVVDHLHAQRLGHDPDLGADMAVADDPQGLAAHLVAAGGGFGPAATVALRVFLRNAAGQHDGFGNHQLGHRAGVGIRRIEHRHAGQLRRFQVDLVGADAETAHRDQALGMAEHLGAELGARTDADDVRLGDALDQLLFRQRLGMRFDLAVTGRAEGVDRRLADPLQQQNMDALLGVGGLFRRHGSADRSMGEAPVCQIWPPFVHCAIKP